MKYKIFKTLLAVVIATMTFCAEAATETVNGLNGFTLSRMAKRVLELGVLSTPIRNQHLAQLKYHQLLADIPSLASRIMRLRTVHLLRA